MAICSSPFPSRRLDACRKPALKKAFNSTFATSDSAQQSPHRTMPRLAQEQRAYAIRDLYRLSSGQTVKVAGLVTHRQRPQTASGVIFLGMEDETGITNVWFGRAFTTDSGRLFAQRICSLSKGSFKKNGKHCPLLLSISNPCPWTHCLQVETSNELKWRGTTQAETEIPLLCRLHLRKPKPQHDP